MKFYSKPKNYIIAFCLVFFLYAVALSVNAKEVIPLNAYKYRHTLMRDVQREWGLKHTNLTALFAAQIEQESSWNPNAVNSVTNAFGLGQFMPATAKEFNVSKLPKSQIRGLVKYNKWVFDRIEEAYSFLDRVAFTLSGYNGGYAYTYRPNKRDRKMTKNKGGDPNIWFGNVEHYSHRRPSAFKENRDYIEKILLQIVFKYIKAGFGQAIKGA